MGLYSRKWIILFIFNVLFFTRVMAQNNTCDCNFKNLKDLYLVGQFESLEANITCCIATPKRLTLNEMNRMKELLTLLAIAQDKIDEANEYLYQIVSSNSNYEPETQNIIFLDLFYKARKENLRVTVSSVSKHPEDVETAPAVVKIIESKDIVARGYVDLIDLLSDIPGFEISKTYSLNFANVYQLGFRQESTQRTLLMVDGVEENDLYSNIAYLSRQYPISNIKAVEILYGPSATMYGPRAFMGTINIITYSPKEEAGNFFENETLEKGNSLYFHGNFARGSFNSYDLDFTMGNSSKDKKIYFQLTGRYYKSDEHDMSDMPFFDYDPADLDIFEYDYLNQSFATQGDLNSYLETHNLSPNSPYYDIVGNEIQLTDYGKNIASEYDRNAYLERVNGNYVKYSNSTENFFIGGKIGINNLVLGFRGWRRAEGMNHMQDLYMAPSRNGSIWAPTNMTTYLKYNYSFNDNLSFSAQTTIKEHSLGRDTNRVNFLPFGNPLSNLSIPDLVHFNSDSSGLNQTPHGWRNQFYDYQALQGRTELRFFYASEHINIALGADRRMTTSQGDYVYYRDFDTDLTKTEYADKGNQGLAEEFGLPSSIYSSINNNYKVVEFGTFLQGNFILGESFHLNAGMRYDRQLIRSSEGYEVFEPRLGIVLTSDLITFKTNYSRGFQNVSLFSKFSTGGNRFPNPNLRPEEIKYIDASLLGKSLNEKFKWTLTAFIYDVKDAITSTILRNGLNQLINESDYLTIGGMANIGYRTNKFRFDLNGTYFDPLETEDAEDFLVAELQGENIIENKKVGDIANIRLNLGVTSFLENEVFESSINVRANYVGEKKVGPETSQKFNLGLNGTGLFQEYFVLNSNIILGLKEWPSAKIALSVNNILNQLYYHPGIHEAAGSFELYPKNEGETYLNFINRTLVGKHVPFVPQRRRHFNLKLILDL
jgi:outer membrane receptor for ferrienterochelin and colicins